MNFSSGAGLSFQSAGGSNTTVGKISVAGNLTLNSNAVAVTVNGSAKLAPGTYRLLDCTGTLAGSANPVPVIGPISGYAATVSTTTGELPVMWISSCCSRWIRSQPPLISFCC